MRPVRFGRAEFLAERWNYSPGEHVSLTAPTQAGKTTMLFDLLAHTDTSFCSTPPVALIAKPSDPVPARLLERDGWREISRWPPDRKWWTTDPDPPGYGLWPKHLRNAAPEVNDAHLAAQFSPAIHELYWKGKSILVVDETYYLCAKLGLSEHLTDWWTKGAGMKAALWDATQKPSGTQQGSVPSFRYNSAEHTFLGFDPDERNRKRFGEIGGRDPKELSAWVMALAPYEWLYLHRRTGTTCVIQAA